VLSIAETFLFKFAVLGRKDYENKLFLLISNIDEFALVEIYFNGLLKSPFYPYLLPVSVTK
jgi:hypothetical protein